VIAGAASVVRTTCEPSPTPDEALQQAVARLLDGRPAPRVLDAGCGEQSALRVPPDAHVVGVDISAELLARNERLDERITADLESDPLPSGDFDLVVCWDVLEHLRRPVPALERLAAAVGEDGLLVLGLPNAASTKGLVTKLTPHRFHRWAYRRLLGSGAEPFPTFLRLSITPGALHRFARRNGLVVEYFGLHEAELQRAFLAARPVVRAAWRCFSLALRAITLGHVQPDLGEVRIVLRQPR
jgi:SAM-dependent methyltransferase